MDLACFESLPIIGIIRSSSPEQVEGAVEAALSAGLQHIEITLNTPSALELIKTIKSRNFPGLTLGAGTVLSRQEAISAIEAGAEFIVSPIADQAMIAYCRHKSTPVFPGALTPAEIQQAWTSGANMVKVFPSASLGGAQYFKYLKGPFAEIKLLACGGVTPENMAEYFTAGASAIAIGNS
ncbi:MAG: bifunctional 4-hydroxy-2-oxoglutarate aldolase/2-dehydro-3-deoxy-phosphogluconate aldolase, partial [Candidatus Margulisiibacteriota bacterium]